MPVTSASPTSRPCTSGTCGSRPERGGSDPPKGHPGVREGRPRPGRPGHRRAPLGRRLLAVARSASSPRNEARTTAADRDRRTWEGQGERNPHGTAHFSSWAFKPQTALSVFEPGLTPLLRRGDLDGGPLPEPGQPPSGGGRHRGAALRRSLTGLAHGDAAPAVPHRARVRQPGPRAGRGAVAADGGERCDRSERARRQGPDARRTGHGDRAALHPSRAGRRVGAAGAGRRREPDGC